MRRDFYVPPRFSPLRSLLGLAIRRVVRDARQAEGVFLVVLPALVLLVILLQMVAWTWIASSLAANDALAMRIFLAQVAGVLAVFLTCGIGFVPAVRVSASRAQLRIRQGRRTRTLDLAEIQALMVVTALRFHREFRPFRKVEVFLSWLTPDVLLLDTPHGMVGVALRAPDLQALVAMLQQVPVERGALCGPAVVEV